MSLIARESSGKDFDPVPAGMHQAVCYGIVDLGTQQPMNPQHKPAHKVVFLWEIPSERVEFTRDDKKYNLPRGISRMITLSLSAKSNLRPMLESWRGRPFTPAELEGFDLKTVLGANCLLNVIHAPGQGANAGKTYANVSSVNPLAKGMPRLTPENPTLFFSIPDSGPFRVPDNIPDWLKAKILQSDEYIKQSQTATAPAAEEEPMPAGAEDPDLCPF